MTQDVQPLTWSKRTNIEEHQQFFSKINEIIGNLAPTVDEAEQAIAQATAAIASANDAVATANAASAAASAAASQAQTAASTVAGYNTRLTAAEGDIDTNTANITALQNVQADYVKKAGAAQTVTSQIMVPTTVAGARDTQIANGTRIQNDLDNYAAMIRTTGNQIKSGILTLIDGISAYDNDWHPTYADKGSMGDLKLFAKLRNSAMGKYFIMEFIQSSNTALCYGIAGVRNTAEFASGALGWFIRKGFGTNIPLQIDAIALVSDGTDWYLASRKKVTYGTLMVRIKVANNYTKIDNYPTSQIEWLNKEVNIGDGAGYTVIEALE